MTENNEENIVRKTLKNEITWIIFLVTGVWGFVSTVVLPLQKLQIQVTAIQQAQIDVKTNYEVLMQDHRVFETQQGQQNARLDVLENEVKTLTK